MKWIIGLAALGLGTVVLFGCAEVAPGPSARIPTDAIPAPKAVKATSVGVPTRLVRPAIDLDSRKGDVIRVEENGEWVEYEVVGQKFSRAGYMLRRKSRSVN